MVRRAKLPRNGSNRIDPRLVPYGNRELAGWPEGVAYSPRPKKKRKKRVKAKQLVATVQHITTKILVGTPL